MVCLMRLAREESGGLSVGSSGGGGMADAPVIAESDIALIHGSGLTSGQFHDFAHRVRREAGDKPVVCKRGFALPYAAGCGAGGSISWGYYNNYTKQIPPADYGVTPGEDLFFARRMARAVGIELPALPREEQFALQTCDNWSRAHGLRAVRLAAEYPERIAYVDFFRNGQKRSAATTSPSIWTARPPGCASCTPSRRAGRS